MTPLETVTAALEARGHSIKHGATRCPAHNDTCSKCSGTPPKMEQTLQKGWTHEGT